MKTTQTKQITGLIRLGRVLTFRQVPTPYGGYLREKGE